MERISGTDHVADSSESFWETAPLELLENELTTMAARLASATGSWLGWLAVYDRRAGYETWGCRTSAQWLNWKCSMSYAAAHEHVRVARALEGLPIIRCCLAAGRLSYSKVRAMTRVANPDNDANFCELALASTAAQLDVICAGYPKAAKGDNESESEARAYENRRVTSRHNDDGTCTIVIVLPTAEAKQVVGAIDIEVDHIVDDVRSDLTTRRDVITERGGIAAIRADALVAVVTGPSSSHASVARLEVLVDINNLTSRDVCQVDNQRIAAETARRLGCDAQVSTT